MPALASPSASSPTTLPAFAVSSIPNSTLTSSAAPRAGVRPANAPRWSRRSAGSRPAPPHGRRIPCPCTTAHRAAPRAPRPPISGPTPAFRPASRCALSASTRPPWHPPFPRAPVIPPAGAQASDTAVVARERRSPRRAAALPPILFLSSPTPLPNRRSTTDVLHRPRHRELEKTARATKRSPSSGSPSSFVRSSISTPLRGAGGTAGDLARTPGRRGRRVASAVRGRGRIGNIDTAARSGADPFRGRPGPGPTRSGFGGPGLRACRPPGSRRASQAPLLRDDLADRRRHADLRLAAARGRGTHRRRTRRREVSRSRGSGTRCPAATGPLIGRPRPSSPFLASFSPGRIPLDPGPVPVDGSVRVRRRARPRVCAAFGGAPPGGSPPRRCPRPGGAASPNARPIQGVFVDFRLGFPRTGVLTFRSAIYREWHKTRYGVSFAACAVSARPRRSAPCPSGPSPSRGSSPSTPRDGTPCAHRQRNGERGGHRRRFRPPGGLRDRGPPLTVTHKDGALTVAYDDLPWKGFLKWLDSKGWRRSAVVSLTVPASTRVEVGVVGANAMVSGVDAARTSRGSRATRHSWACPDRSAPRRCREAWRPRGHRGARLNSVSGDLTVIEGACPLVKADSVSGSIILDLDPTSGPPTPV